MCLNRPRFKIILLLLFFSFFQRVSDPVMITVRVSIICNDFSIYLVNQYFKLCSERALTKR